MTTRLAVFGATLAFGALVAPTHSAPAFVNGVAVPATTLDASGGVLVNDGRMGFFSDIFYDPQRSEWWALSDRGPGGGTLPYETRIHRFTLDVDAATGAISNFRIRKTIIFRQGANALDGISPPEAAPVGFALDPEGVVVNPRNGNLLVSDEYGPSLVEVSRAGQLVRRYDVPTNLLPRNASTGVVNHAGDAGNTAGKRTNRGFEGLAISPDGLTVYAMLQSAMLDEGAGNGVYNRIVAFDTRTTRVIGQYAYKMEASSQGRGISALVAINDTDFLVLERNNRGLGVDAELTPPNKKVFRISLTGASDVSGIDLDASGASFTTVSKDLLPWLDLAAPTILAHPSLATLGGVSPEKWEGLAIGPKLQDGSHLVLAGTDNDYSVTQVAGSTTQFDRYFKVVGGAVTRIQCDIGTLANCRSVGTDGSVGAAIAAGTDLSGFSLIPGVLHAYKASAADLAGLVLPGSQDNRDRSDRDDN
jgi:hypothetical protein